VALRLPAFDEPLDGIIYASFIALGYAAIENYYYLDFLTGLESAARGFAGPVIHILFASIWAHWITRAWLAIWLWRLRLMRRMRRMRRMHEAAMFDPEP